MCSGLWRAFAFFAAAFLAVLATEPTLARTPMAQVTASQLNVRESPSADAKMIGSLTTGSIVSVITVQAPWAYVLWFPDLRDLQNVKRGWVSAEHLQVLRRSSGSSSSYTSSNGASFYLSIDEIDLDCSEHYGGGLSDCEVTVEVSYESDYNGNDEPQVSVECQVEVWTGNAGGFRSYESESGDEYFYGRDGFGEIELDFSFYSIGSPIVRAGIDDAECEITDVY